MNVITYGFLSLKDFEKVISSNMTFEGKTKLLNNAIMDTYNKHGLEQAIHALMMFKYKGDTEYFSGMKNRILLFKNISIDDVNLILSCVKKNSDNVLYDYVTSIVKNPFDLIVNAYFETLKKYGKDQADYAILRYVLNNDVKYFTNNECARENIKSINCNEIVNILLKGLDVTDVSSANELVEIFVEQMSYNKKNL